jgi:uncharacterized protein YxjI
MQLLFKQRLFSWFDSYDIYDEAGNTAYTVQGRLAWGHKLEISDRAGRLVGMVKEEILTFLPRFEIHVDGQVVGEIRKEFSLFHPVYSLDCNGWKVSGDILGWSYEVTAPDGRQIMFADKRLLNWTDTYVIDIADPADALLCLMIVLAIDAANCSQK